MSAASRRLSLSGQCFCLARSLPNLKSIPILAIEKTKGGSSLEIRQRQEHLYRGCGSGGSCTARAIPAHIFGVTFAEARTLHRAPALSHTAKEMAVFALVTGVHHTVAAYGYRGGSLFERRDFSMAGTLVKHPQGDLLIDTGFGRNIDEQFHTMPLIFRAITSYSLW